jgi:hypothetical protein
MTCIVRFVSNCLVLIRNGVIEMTTNVSTVLLNEKLQEIKDRELQDTPSGTVLSFPKYTEAQVKAMWADGWLCL